MPDPTIKQTFITALRETPPGILTFLERKIPDPPACSAPADVDAAIIANGICAAYVLDLFRPFAGLTPIELLLRIGQHNSILEAGLLAGLQYIGETATQQDIAILSPKDGATLQPGKVRLQAKAKNGTMTQCAAEIGDTPVNLDDTDGVFEGYVTLETDGDYTATFYGLFGDDNTQKTATVSFTIAAAAEDAEPPGGTDKEALDTAVDDFTSAVQELLTAIAGNSPIGFILDKWDLAKAAYATLKSVAGLAGAAAGAVLDEAEGLLNDAKAAIEGGAGDALEKATDYIGDAAAKVKNAVSQFLDKIL